MRVRIPALRLVAVRALDKAADACFSAGAALLRRRDALEPPEPPDPAIVERVLGRIKAETEPARLVVPVTTAYVTRYRPTAAEREAAKTAEQSDCSCFLLRDAGGRPAYVLDDDVDGIRARLRSIYPS